MALFDRFRNRPAALAAPPPPPTSPPPPPPASAHSDPPARAAVFAPPHRPQSPTLPWGELVMVVGESHYQDAISRVAGGRTRPGHNLPCVVTLAPEPSNPYDPGAVVATISGSTVGYLSRGDARTFRPIVDKAIQEYGAARVHGCITGGWDRGPGDNGSFGVDLFFSPFATAPRSMDEMVIVPSPGPDEVRLVGSATVSVVNEEHYQDALKTASASRSLDVFTYPVLVDLVEADRNPHAKAMAPVLRVTVAGETVGYLTPAMSARLQRVLARARAEGKRLTCTGHIFKGSKAGQEIVEIRLAAPPHAVDETVVVDPHYSFEIDCAMSRRVRTLHKIKAHGADGSCRTMCGVVIPSDEVLLFASTKPWLATVDPVTHSIVTGLEGCLRC